MQKFLECSMISNYIKYLMMATHLPKCSYLSDGDIMLKDNYYLYRGNVYYCRATGAFRGSKSESYSYTYCSDAIICGKHINDNGKQHTCGPDCELRVNDSETLFGQAKLAEYSLVSTYVEGDSVDGLTDTFLSNKLAYDSDTHARLGEYLRMLKSQYGLNLMSLYNCYCGKFVDNVSVEFTRDILEDGTDVIVGKHLSDNTSNNQRVTLVPIKFNKKYTIAMTSSFPVYIAPVLYDGKMLRTKEGDLLLPASSNITKIGSCTSSRPIQFEVGNYDPLIGQHERSLYLMISLNKSVETPVIVLEGEHTQNSIGQRSISDASIFRRSNEADVEKLMSGTCSLLQISSGKISDTPAFSDKLIGYLLGHYIDQRDPISENISRVISDIGYSHGKDKGWNTRLRKEIYDNYMNNRHHNPDRNYDDILGYVDSDIERAIMRGEMYIGK